MKKWNDTNKKMPTKFNKFGETDYLLCLEDEYDIPVTCWYNKKEREWHYAHHKMTGNPKVCYWMPLPQIPIIC